MPVVWSRASDFFGQIRRIWWWCWLSLLLRWLEQGLSSAAAEISVNKAVSSLTLIWAPASLRPLLLAGLGGEGEGGCRGGVASLGVRWGSFSVLVLLLDARRSPSSLAARSPRWWPVDLEWMVSPLPNKSSFLYQIRGDGGKWWLLAGRGSEEELLPQALAFVSVSPWPAAVAREGGVETAQILLCSGGCLGFLSGRPSSGSIAAASSTASSPHLGQEL